MLSIRYVLTYVGLVILDRIHAGKHHETPYNPFRASFSVYSPLCFVLWGL